MPRRLTARLAALRGCHADSAAWLVPAPAWLASLSSLAVSMARTRWQPWTKPVRRAVLPQALAGQTGESASAGTAAFTDSAAAGRAVLDLGQAQSQGNPPA